MNSAHQLNRLQNRYRRLAAWYTNLEPDHTMTERDKLRLRQLHRLQRRFAPVEMEA